MDTLVGRWMLRGGGEMTRELLGLGLGRLGLCGRGAALMGREDVPVGLWALRWGIGTMFSD